MIVKPPETSATQRIVEYGEPSSQPDTSWLWRRWLIFIVTIACLLLAWRVIERITDATTLRMVAQYCLGLVGLCVFVYAAGATATDIIKLTTAVRTSRKETVTTAPPPSTIGEDGGVTAGEPKK